MPNTKTKEDVARAIIGLSYVEMTDLADMLVASVKSDHEDGVEFDALDRNQWCERLRWWAEGWIDAVEDSR